MKAGVTDPLRRYTEIYNALNTTRRWWEGAFHFRFAVLPLTLSRGPAQSIAESIQSIAETMKRSAGWFGALHSSLRFVIASILLREGDDPAAFIGEVERVRGLFRTHALPRGGLYEIIAILVMRSHRRPILDLDVIRFKAMYDEMKRRHWWLTGAGDFPHCAVFATLEERPSEVGKRVDHLYELLLAADCTRGDPLQRVSHLLYLNPKPDGDVVARFAKLRDAFRAAGTKIYVSDWDELALLTYPDQPVSTIVQETLRARDAMLELKPAVNRWIAFTLGSSLTFLKLCGLGAPADVKTLEDFQHILQAQQAAAAAGAAGAAT